LVVRRFADPDLTAGKEVGNADSARLAQLAGSHRHFTWYFATQRPSVNIITSSRRISLHVLH